jgi:Zn finger protein HypA/HybF involved in hydrogenase expression
MSVEEFSYVDGNALGGVLGEVFGFEVTAALASCRFCGTASRVGQWQVFLDAPGSVARCPACGSVQLRVVRTRSRLWLDVSGVRSLEVDLPEEAG